MASRYIDSGSTLTESCPTRSDPLHQFPVHSLLIIDPRFFCLPVVSLAETVPQTLHVPPKVCGQVAERGRKRRMVELPHVGNTCELSTSSLRGETIEEAVRDKGKGEECVAGCAHTPIRNVPIAGLLPQYSTYILETNVYVIHMSYSYTYTYALA